MTLLLGETLNTFCKFYFQNVKQFHLIKKIEVKEIIKKKVFIILFKMVDD